MNHAQFRKSFEDCSLLPEQFGHGAHIRMAWIYVTAHPLSEAIKRFCADLRRYVTHVGAEGKYHETITWFYMVLVNERTSLLDSQHSWEEFRNANSDLFEPGGFLLKQHYRSETLGSAKAKTTFVLPDTIVA